ncbi:hypothetical protein Tco_0459494 [Tanacetum coccineum]
MAGSKSSRDMFSPYRGPNHELLSSLSKSPREILATEKVARSFEKPPRMLGSRQSRDMSKFCYFHKDHGNDTNDCRQLRSQIEEVVRSGQLSYLVKGIKKERTKTSDSQRGEKKEKSTTLLRRGRNSSAPVFIKAKVFGREVGRVHMDSGSSCKVIYEHCFLKLKPSIQASKVESQVLLVSFSGEKSWAIGEVLLEITIGYASSIRRENSQLASLVSLGIPSKVLPRQPIKGYHSKFQMAEEDDDKTASSQEIESTVIGRCPSV